MSGLRSIPLRDAHLREDSGLFDEIEERTGIKGLGDGLRQILPGLLGQ